MYAASSIGIVHVIQFRSQMSNCQHEDEVSSGMLNESEQNSRISEIKVRYAVTFVSFANLIWHVVYFDILVPRCTN